jgi:hypothetical protein
MIDRIGNVGMRMRVFGDEWLKLRALVLGDKCMLQVVEQKWRGKKFAPWEDIPDWHVASASCGDMLIASRSCPEIQGVRQLFVQGQVAEKDSTWMGPVDAEWVDRCALVVADYNEKAAAYERGMRKPADDAPCTAPAEPRDLELLLETDAEGNRLISVIRQSGRCDDFAPEGALFEASNGFSLVSVNGPSPDTNAMYVRGRCRRFDNAKEPVPSDAWLARLRVSVREFNAAWSAARAEKKSEEKPKEPTTEVIS